MGGGKGGGRSGGAKDYYGSIAGLVCAGPVDELVAIIVDKKTVWEGPMSRTAPGVSNPQTITIAGYGSVIFYWGTEDQTVNTSLTPELASHPPYRRQAWCVLKDFLFGRERTSAPNVEFVVRRSPRQSLLSGSPALLDRDAQANSLAALAELVTDPVFGLGQPATLLHAPSWQATADALSAEASRTHLSVVLDRGATFRAAAAELLGYYDGWLRWDANGEIEAGRFLHNEAPPEFTEATTIDFHDMVEEAEFDADGWATTANDVLVRFRDRARAFKDGAARVMSGWNREVVGEPRQKRIDLPFIARAQQAADYAAEQARIAAEPALSGSLTVRAEKASAILPGDLFLLEHDAVSLSIICRCIEKTHPAPDAGRVQLRFVSERGLAPMPHHTSPSGIGGPEVVAPERVDLFQIVQVPPVLAGGDTTVRLAVLAARTSPLSLGLFVHLKRDDEGGLLYDLGGQGGWAVTGVLAQDYGADAPAEGTSPPDDDGETLRLTVDPATVAADLSKISATQSADAINDANLLVWLFKAADRSQFEVLTLKAIRIVGGESSYRLKVRRGRFGTRQLAFSAGDRAFIVFGAELTTYGHSQFPAYAAAGATATFRLQSFNAWGDADLADPDICPDRNYTFADPYAPTAVWQSVKRNGVEVTDFSADFALTDEFTVTVQGTDPNSDLISLAIVARLGSEITTPLSVTTAATPSLTRSATFRPSNHGISEGDWRLYAIVQDATGRKREVQMNPGGGESPVLLRLRTAPGAVTACIAPIATPAGGPVLGFPLIVSLATSTEAATIEFQISSLGGSIDGPWVRYTDPVSIPGIRSLHARTTKEGSEESPVVREDYWGVTDTSLPGWSLG